MRTFDYIKEPVKLLTPEEEYDMWRYNAPDNTEGSQPLTGRSEEI